MTSELRLLADVHAPATADRLEVERLVHAPHEAVFDLLADPSRHHLTEPTDWVRGSLEADPPRLAEAGQVFGIEMFHVAAGGRYEMQNVVLGIEPGRSIAWEPASRGESGAIEGGGWYWRYDLEDRGEDTLVRLSYDWAATPPEIAEEIGGLPSVGEDFLHESLAALARAVETPRSEDQQGER